MLSAKILAVMPASLIAAISWSSSPGEIRSHFVNTIAARSAVVSHDEVAVEPDVEVVVAGLDDEGNIDVRGDHLEIHGLAGTCGAGRSSAGEPRGRSPGRPVMGCTQTQSPTQGKSMADAAGGHSTSPQAGALPARPRTEGAAIDRSHAGDASAPGRT